MILCGALVLCDIALSFGARVTEEDILVAARQRQGLERLCQIRFAILETTGGISVIPAAEQASRA